MLRRCGREPDFELLWRLEPPGDAAASEGRRNRPRGLLSQLEIRLLRILGQPKLPKPPSALEELRTGRIIRASRASARPPPSALQA